MSAPTVPLNERRYWFGSEDSRWALSSYHIGTDGDPYMFRWILRTPGLSLRWVQDLRSGTLRRILRRIQIPRFSLRVHKIMRSDRDDALHDHPAELYVFLGTGGYVEVLADGPVATRRVRRRMWSFRHVPADRPHRLILTRPVWTLSIALPRDRIWGFYPKRYDAAGLVPAKTWFEMQGSKQ